MCTSELGACCYNDPIGYWCTVVTQTACETIPGATFKGAGTNCDDGDLNGMADVCE